MVCHLDSGFFLSKSFQNPLLWYIIIFVWAHKGMVCRKMWYGMNCKEAEKKISSFLQDDLDGRNLAEFVEHIDACPECMEELSIQFLVAEGMEQLEKGNSFNLQEALHYKLADADYRIRLNRTLRHILIWLEAAVAVAIVIALCVVMRL